MNKIDEYVKNMTWQVKENANSGYSFSGLQLFLAEDSIKKHWLENIYSKDIKSAYENGYFYIHDLGFYTVYCMGHDLKTVLEQGINGVPKKLHCVPPKHLRTAVNQMTNYLFSCQSESAGANAFSNVDTLLAPYVKKENLSYKEVKQCMQEFIYTMNMPFRVGFQSVFSNVTFDLKCPEMYKNKKPVINNEEMPFTYGDCNPEIGMVAKAFFEIMMEGDGAGQPFTFPIPTVNLHKNFVWDDEVAKVIFESTAKYGTASFQNFINGNINPEDTYSLCCRIRLDKKEIEKRAGGIFGNAPGTGSIGVCTINLPLIAYESKTEEQFFKTLEKYMDLAKESLEVKRKVITNNFEIGLMPYLKRYLKTFKNHFSTIATLGANEMCLNFLEKDITTKEGIEFTEKVLNFMLKKIQGYQEETGNLFNLEQAPAESASYKLAKISKEKHEKIIASGTKDTPYFTNSSHLPVNNDFTILQTIKHQERFNNIYNGGSIVHFYLGEKLTDWINCMILVKKIAENSTLPFFSISPKFSLCPVHGYISGEHKFCPLTHTKEQLEKHGIMEEILCQQEQPKSIEKVKN